MTIFPKLTHLITKIGLKKMMIKFQKFQNKTGGLPNIQVTMEVKG